MKAWEEFSKVQKILSTCAAFIGAIVILFGFIFVGYTHFATRAYADEGDKKVEDKLHTYQKQQIISSNRAEIWRAKREIKRLIRELPKESVSLAEKTLINADIAEYKELIVCIQDAKDLCY